MEIFNYVMVLASIIIGLAITHLLKGIARVVVHPEQNRPYWVHLVWIAWLFLLTVSWWWFQFRLSSTVWTLGFYLFILFYAALLYLSAALLFPTDLEGYRSFKDYFYQRRRWIFGLVMAIGLTDIVDTALKGWDHFANQGVLYPAYAGVALVFAVVAMITQNKRFHATYAVLMLSGQVAVAVSNYNTVR